MRRFWDKVDKTPTCWNWTAYKDPCGYGRFRLDGISIYAHRFAYETKVGDIPKKLQIDHLCRNRACVNPAHMEAVTPRTNTLRGKTQAALHAGKTHCPQGHAYAGENLALWSGAGFAGHAAGKKLRLGIGGKNFARIFSRCTIGRCYSRHLGVFERGRQAVSTLGIILVMGGGMLAFLLIFGGILYLFDTPRRDPTMRRVLREWDDTR